MRRALALVVAAAALAPAASAELRRVERVGVVGLVAGETWSTPPRDAAIRRGLADAVRSIALEHLPHVDPVASADLLDPVLGEDPFVYASRFRILEDRGERSALLIDDPDMDREYVVVVEAYVDEDRVRDRLAAAGLLDPTPHGAGPVRVRVVVTGVVGYAEFAGVREALRAGTGSETATPVEITRGRAVFEVLARSDGAGLARRIAAAAGPELRIVPVEEKDGALLLHVERRAPPPEPADREPGAFDTRGRKGY